MIKKQKWILLVGCVLTVPKLLHHVVAIGEKLMNRPIFGYDYNGTNIEWTWNVSPIEKMSWKTWRPRLNNIKIISSGLDDATCVIIKEDIYKTVMDSEYPKNEKLTGMYKQRGYK